MTCKVFAILVVVLATWPARAKSEPSSARRNGARSNSKVAETRIDGAGSQSIYPLLSAWIDGYSHLHAGIRISYQAIGSRGGSRQLADRTTSFAATDVPMSDDQLAAAKGQILHFPVALNAVVPVYNLAQVPELRFSGATLADIFLGKITKWNDLAIANDNPGVDLPRMDIRVVHSFPNGSVETDIMADYLSKISPTFKATLANSSSANWPVASGMVGYKGAEGMPQIIRETPGSIGYLSLARASFELARIRQSPLKYGAVRNSDGEFVTATSESLTAASAAEVPFIQTQGPDFRVSITNAPGKGSYPIASFIWLLVYEDSTDAKQHEVMADFLKWVLTDGQKLALKLGYPALPDNLVKIELDERLGNVSR